MVFKVAGSALFSHCMTICGSIQLLVCSHLSDCVFDNSHCVIVTRVNEHRFDSDFRHLSAISQNLSASKNRG